MSKINELIEALCPEGVPFKKLGEIGYFYGGLTGKSKDDFKDGNAVFITYMNVFSNIELKTDVTDRVRVGEKEKQNTVQYGDVLFTGSSETPDECGMSSVLTTHTDEKLYLNSFCFGYRFNDPEMFLPGFTKHLFRSDDLRYQITRTASGVTRFNVSKKKMEDVRIPVPPKEVQREIIHVLDEFTLLTSELSAELSARRKQYEYYRGELLDFNVDIPKKKLGQTCAMKAGKAIPSEAISVEQSIDYPVACYGGNGVRGYVKGANQHGEFPLIGRQGALCGNVNYATGDFYATEHAVVVSSQGEYTQRFLYHLLTHMDLNQYKSAGAQPGLSVKNLQEILAPVPTIDVQNKIVDILDNFEAICSDLNIGLPAEINARQKQYEYYRDLLLTFVENGSTILTDRQTG